ncbi:predicted protein [Nematostella vectensis]|uniref:Spermatogenesis-associated protein 22 n=1 Tax=Nematostella vectensis TaxID=45351 RepID=A7S2Z4_NEMVE|nr:spermatogenesis-associated protein 22 [Nematostella vectensis]EDO41866.1 predicted protein [Nematostella vectensis]|eukprot:XP_001633929.1 predicted protein [Nematostella vectensis]
MNNKRPNTGVNGNRSIIPIFTNKRRRIKQALYANPTEDMTSTYFGNNNNNTNNDGEEVSFLGTNPTVNSYTGFGPGNNNSFKSPGSFGRNQGQPSSFNKNVNQDGSRRGFSFSSGLGKRNQSIMDRKSFPNNTFGRGNQSGPNGRNNTNKISNPNLKTLPPPLPSVKRPQESKSFSWKQWSPPKKSPAQPLLSRTIKPNGTGQQLGRPQEPSQEQSQLPIKQVNPQKDHADHSLRMITATVKNLQQWSLHKDQLTMLFEVFGILDSAVAPSPQAKGKNFVLKDNTGSIRCTFWEMDRMLPRLIRGQPHRCVGFVERQNGVFICVSIRPTSPNEHRVTTASQSASEKAMQECLASFREH